MAGLRFEWDERKNRSNRAKHHVSFEEARTAFFDDQALVIDDPEHSDEEDRFILMGLSTELRVLVVCHCCREEGDVVRIISARCAERREQAQYKEGQRR